MDAEPLGIAEDAVQNPLALLLSQKLKCSTSN